jgi:hypothetical protein
MHNMPYIRLLRWPFHFGVGFEWPKALQRYFEKPIQVLVVDSVHLRHVIDEEDGEPEFLVTVLEFNGASGDTNDPDHVDLNQLRSSTEKDGVYFIWTCSCGVPGCAGMEHGVQVDHLEDRTNWHDLDRKRKFQFDTQALRDALRRAIIEGRKLLTSRPALKVIPSQNEGVYDNQ